MSSVVVLQLTRILQSLSPLKLDSYDDLGLNRNALSLETGLTSVYLQLGLGTIF